MTPTSEQGIQVIFEEKNNRPAWDRWGKDVAGIAASLIGNAAGGAIGGALSGVTAQVFNTTTTMAPTTTSTQ